MKKAPNLKQVHCCYNCKHQKGDYCEAMYCGKYDGDSDLDTICDSYESAEAIK